MDWVDAVAQLRADGRAGVLATVVEVRGHAPRAAGSKMVVSSDACWGSVGGGNMEASVIERARQLLAAGQAAEPEIMEFGLNEHSVTTHGTQCCGGVVRVLLEQLRPRHCVAVFGLGHVGSELARILSRQELALHLVDSRPGILTEETEQVIRTGPAQVSVHIEPAPETVLADLPRGATVLVLTHDHAEDLAICDSALRIVATDPEALASIGVIGSSAKWARFRKRLIEAGHPEPAVERIQCPIGVPDITDKHPSVIAISVAADLMRIFSKDPS